MEKVKRMIVDKVTGKSREQILLVETLIDSRKIIRAKFDSETQADKFIKIMQGKEQI